MEKLGIDILKELGMGPLDRGHGSPYDRGRADSYYRRNKRPHYRLGQVEIDEKNMTEEEKTQYLQGFLDNEKVGDFKDYGWQNNQDVLLYKYS